MTLQEIDTAKEKLRQWAVRHSGGCDIQDGWPCGTCFTALLDQLGVKEDGEHNAPVNRVNEVWRALLQIREQD